MSTAITKHSASATRLTGWSLHLIRLLWLLSASLIFYQIARTTLIFRAEALSGGVFTDLIREGGISPALFYPVEFGINSVQLIVWVLISLFFVWKGSDDWQMLNLALLGLVQGYFRTSFDTIVGPVDPINIVLDVITFFSFLLFMGTFPNGRFVPRWIRPLFVLFFIYVIILAIVNLIDPAISLRSETLQLILHEAIIQFAALYAQIYRLNKTTTVQRQQTKWVVYGIALLLVANIIEKTIMFTSGQTVYLVTRPLVALLIMGNITVFMFAMLRYRIWDIDFVINRSLVYGGLTLLLGGVFMGVFALLQSTIRLLFAIEQTGLMAVVSVGVTAIFFQPARGRLRRFVDRRLYGIEVDYRQAIHDQKQAFALESAKKPSRPLGRYEVGKRIGKGGMGEVYRGRDTESGDEVAIKLMSHLHIEQDEHRRRFVREAEVIAALQHPNIVKMLSVSEENEIPYIVLEFIDGQNLEMILKKQGTMPFDQTSSILKQIAAALDYAHKNNIIHRDVKPSNVMVEAVGTPPRAVLTDFGIARIAAEVTRITHTGGLLGTLIYTSPEQIKGAEFTSPQSDIYSFGVMAFEMLTGQPPFTQTNPGALLLAHLRQPAPDPRSIVPTIPPMAAIAVMKAMEKKAEARFASADEMMRDFK